MSVAHQTAVPQCHCPFSDVFKFAQSFWSCGRVNMGYSGYTFLSVYRVGVSTRGGFRERRQDGCRSACIYLYKTYRQSKDSMRTIQHDTRFYIRQISTVLDHALTWPHSSEGVVANSYLGSGLSLVRVGPRKP